MKHPIWLSCVWLAASTLWLASCDPEELVKQGAVKNPDEPPVRTIWQPAPGTTWQWQLTDQVNTSYDVDMYDIDLFDTPPAVIEELHQRGIAVICYFSAGSWENWRDDLKSLGFIDQVVGPTLDGWPDEKWFDISDWRVRTLMLTRLNLAVSKGCDGVEPDNVDGYTSWPQRISLAQELDYLKFLADEAHSRGLSIGLKNNVELAGQLAGLFDWALNEECLAYDECEALRPFLDDGKAVFHVEYGPASLADEVCSDPTTQGLSSLIKNLELDSWRVACD